MDIDKRRQQRREAQRRYRQSTKGRATEKRYRQSSRGQGTRRSAQLNYYYGLTLEQYSAMLKRQEGKCALCSEECKTGKRLAVDHCHQSGKVRGLLCKNCNVSLGHYEKIAGSPDLLGRTKSYLRSV